MKIVRCVLLAPGLLGQINVGIGFVLLVALLLRQIAVSNAIEINTSGRRCLSDNACGDRYHCLKTNKDDWGFCIVRIAGPASGNQCTSDQDCPSGATCARPNMNAKWTCKKR